MLAYFRLSASVTLSLSKGRRNEEPSARCIGPCDELKYGLGLGFWDWGNVVLFDEPLPVPNEPDVTGDRCVLD